MKTEDKELLLKDLCGRLPYGVKVCMPLYGPSKLTYKIIELIDKDNNSWLPYLRSMSSMTENEKQEYVIAWDSRQPYLPTEAMDWLNAHYFDFRGLIEKSLALEAPEDMYTVDALNQYREP